MKLRDTLGKVAEIPESLRTASNGAVMVCTGIAVASAIVAVFALIAITMTVRGSNNGN